MNYLNAGYFSKKSKERIQIDKEINTNKYNVVSVL